MLRFLKIVILLTVLLYSSIISAQIEYQQPDVPTEENEYQFLLESGNKNEPEFRKSLSGSIAHYLIRFYQRKISVKSVSRCPFHISCSYYALEAIRRKGIILGIAYFIDRNLYRENPSMIHHYPFIIDRNNLFKLDDSFYLLGENP
ncbi:MAG: hypothetical protein Kow00108_01840 [Calditrichia bacterium]